MEKEFMSLALMFILIVSGAQIALSPPALAESQAIPEITFEEVFTLGVPALARLTVGQPEVDNGYYYTFELKETTSGECNPAPENAGCTADSTVIKVTETPGFLSINPQIKEYELVLSNGETSKVIGQDFYAVTVKAVSIDAQNNSASFVVQSVPQETPIIFDKIVQLDEKFDLKLKQKAIVKGENLEVKLTGIYFAACQGPGCPTSPSASVLVTKLGEKNSSTDTLSTSVAAEFSFAQNESKEAFGYKITSTFINDSSAGFFVSKETITEPIEIKVNVGDKFSLKTNQTAQVLESGKKVMKVTVQKIIEQPIYCIKAPCENIRSAYLYFDLGQTGTGFFAQENQTYSINGNYSVTVPGVSSNSATLLISKAKPVDPTVVVYLGKSFDLKEKQKAIVSQTRLEIEFLGTDDGLAKLMVKQPLKYYIEPIIAKSTGAIKSITGNAVIAPTIVSEVPVEQIIEETEKLVYPYIPGQYIYLNEGGSAKVFDHKITLNALKQGNGNSVANIVVSKLETQKTVTAMIGDKFSLQTGQTGIVFDESKETVMKLSLQSIEPLFCTQNATDDFAEGSKYFCDPRPQVFVIASTQDSSANLFMHEGETRNLGNNSVRLLDVSSDQSSAVFVVKKVFDEKIKLVGLNEKFELMQNQTAQIKGEDAFIKLEGINVLKSFPVQRIAQISVWKEYKNDNAYKSYSLHEGESLNLYGLKISAAKIEDNSTVFFAEKKPVLETINVHVGDYFSLQEKQSANVLEANMKINLLSTSIAKCTSSDTPVTENETSKCISGNTAKFSVSQLFLAKPLGETITTEQAAQEVISGNTQEKISVTIIPPTPFETFNLHAGEEVTVNNYSIKLVSVGVQKAEFLVKEKLSGKTVSYTISNGWNLFSMPGELQSNQSTCNTNNWKVFEFNAEKKVFVNVKKPVAGQGYWVYNPDSDCKVSAGIRDPLTINELPSISAGWNFVAPTFDMVGKKITELGNCEVKAVYRWDAENKQWVLVSHLEVMDYKPMNDIGTALAVYSNNKCSLSEESLSPPTFPPIDSDNKVKVFFRPMQCETEPWNNSDTTTGNEEFNVQNFYEAGYSVKLSEVQFERFADAVCEACGICPKGYEVIATIDSGDLEKMLSLGWQKYNN